MALIKLGAVAAEIRGSIGGTVFARNRGGQYIRSRSVPINPASTRQVVVRQRLATLSEAWTNTLTQAQRDAWDLYADNVQLPNRLGELRSVTGLNMYVRGNALLLDTAGTRVDDAPTEFTAGPSFTPTITLDASADTLSVTNLGGYTPSTDGTVGLLIQQGRPQQAGVTFYRSPFQRIDGSQIADEATDLPTDVPLAFPIAAGQAVFIRTATVTPDGRVGVPVVQRFLAS